MGKADTPANDNIRTGNDSSPQDPTLRPAPLPPYEIHARSWTGLFLELSI